jgi:hypothetical protein
VRRPDTLTPRNARRHRSGRWAAGAALAALVALAGLAALSACGSSSSNQSPTPVPTPSPTPTPAPTPMPLGVVCDPTPPPLYGIRVGVIFDSGGERRTLDSRPIVINVDGYCGKAGFGATDKFCFTRQEGDPQAAACDYLAVGKASDTGRYGPTWSWNDKPCTAQPGENGCSNHPDNQFLVTTRGDGEYAACAAPEIPLSQDPDKPGSRCGVCTIKGSARCQ